MRARLVLLGQSFGRLLVVEDIHPEIGHSKARCQCVCGAVIVVDSAGLKIGDYRSCGCSHVEHGHAFQGKHSRTYRTWSAMLCRCGNPSDPGFKHYGGRGVRVCEAWKTFSNFLADMGERPAGMTIDRKDNDGNYEPSNCRWATRSQQMRNRQNTRMVTVGGVTAPLADMAEKFGVNYDAVKGRIDYGWEPEKALTTPIKHHKQL